MDPTKQHSNQAYNPAPPHPGQPSDAAQNYDQPVAYDAQGRPLYAHPPSTQGPQMVYLSRPINPIEQPISAEIKAKQEESRRKFPNLNLSDGEYVIAAVNRHPIGLLSIWFTAFLLIAAIILFFAVFIVTGGSDSVSELGSTESLQSAGIAIILLLSVLVAGGAFIATYIYNNNRFYLTNESVIQEIQTSIFNKHEQTVSLSNIEDASYEQTGILPLMLNYGKIRLSTEGDETTYRFKYVANPKQHIAILNNAVEAFKNGRPVELHSD
jgi:hypothetical protein